jgi:hypothetical protein
MVHYGLYALQYLYSDRLTPLSLNLSQTYIRKQIQIINIKEVL